MSAQVRAELLKLRTSRVPWLLAVLATAGTFVSLSSQATSAANGVAPALASTPLAGGALTAVVVAAVLLGATTLTGEFRHRTIVPTLLANPDRRTVVAAQALAHLLAGGLVGAVAVGLAAAVTWLQLSAYGALGSLPVATVAAVSAGAAVTAGLTAVLGLGVGALVRNQALAVAAVIGIVVIAPLLASASELARWLPLNLANSLVNPHTQGDPGIATAAVTYAGYAWLAAVAGWGRLERAEP